MSKFYGPSYQEDYHNLPWYERDLMTDFNHLKYQEMAEYPDHYVKNKEVANFDLVYYRCCGDRLKTSEKERKTVEKENFENYPKN